MYVLMVVLIAAAVFFDASYGLFTLLGLIVGVTLLGYLALHPKALVLVSLLGITFSRTIERVSGSGVMTYLDEALVVACLVILVGGRLAAGRMPRSLPGGKCLAAFVVVGLLSSAINEVSFSLMAQGAFLAAKALLLAYAVAQIDWKPEDLQRGTKVVAYVVGLMLFGAVINLAVPQAWAGIFQTLAFVDYRFAGLPSIISFTTHPLDLGGLMVFSAVALSAYRSQVKKTKANGLLLAGSILSGILTFRRTTLAAMFAALGGEKLRQKGIVAFLAALLILPIAATFLWDAIAKLATSAYVDYIENADQAARTILTFDSFDVASEYFPLGAGFARYGSYLAATNYSPEYVERGYQTIYGMGPFPNGRFLTDTQWPAIIGETGFIGSAFFIIGMLLVAKHMWHIRLRAEPLLRWVGVTGLGLIASVGIMSVAIPVFTASTFIAPVFVLIGIAAAISRPTAEELTAAKVAAATKKDKSLPSHYQALKPRLTQSEDRTDGVIRS